MSMYISQIARRAATAAPIGEIVGKRLPKAAEAAVKTLKGQPPEGAVAPARAALRPATKKTLAERVVKIGNKVENAGKSAEKARPSAAELKMPKKADPAKDLGSIETVFSVFGDIYFGILAVKATVVGLLASKFIYDEIHN